MPSSLRPFAISNIQSGVTLQVAGIFRKISWVNTATNSGGDSVLGWGINVTSNLNFTENDIGRFEVVYGDGIQNYMNDAPVVNARSISGVRLVPVTFTPSASAYSGQLCQGVSITVLDRNTLNAPELGIELASALLKLYPKDFKIDRMAELLVNQATFDALLAGQDPQRIAEGWREAIERFQETRKLYLLYK